MARNCSQIAVRAEFTSLKAPFFVDVLNLRICFNMFSAGKDHRSSFYTHYCSIFPQICYENQKIWLSKVPMKRNENFCQNVVPDLLFQRISDGKTHETRRNCVREFQREGEVLRKVFCYPKSGSFQYNNPAFTLTFFLTATSNMQFSGSRYVTCIKRLIHWHHSLVEGNLSEVTWRC